MYYGGDVRKLQQTCDHNNSIRSKVEGLGGHLPQEEQEDEPSEQGFHLQSMAAVDWAAGSAQQLDVGRLSPAALLSLLLLSLSVLALSLCCWQQLCSYVALAAADLAPATATPLLLLETCSRNSVVPLAVATVKS